MTVPVIEPTINFCHREGGWSSAARQHLRGGVMVLCFLGTREENNQIIFGGVNHSFPCSTREHLHKRKLTNRSSPWSAD